MEWRRQQGPTSWQPEGQQIPGRLTSPEGLENRKWIRVRRGKHQSNCYYVPNTVLIAQESERHTSLPLESTMFKK